MSRGQFYIPINHDELTKQDFDGICQHVVGSITPMNEWKDGEMVKYIKYNINEIVNYHYCQFNTISNPVLTVKQDGDWFILKLYYEIFYKHPCKLIATARLKTADEIMEGLIEAFHANFDANLPLQRIRPQALEREPENTYNPNKSDIYPKCLATGKCKSICWHCYNY